MIANHLPDDIVMAAVPRCKPDCCARCSLSANFGAEIFFNRKKRAALDGFVSGLHYRGRASEASHLLRTRPALRRGPRQHKRPPAIMKNLSQADPDIDTFVGNSGSAGPCAD